MAEKPPIRRDGGHAWQHVSAHRVFNHRFGKQIPMDPTQLGLGFQMYARPDATVSLAALDAIAWAAEEACYPVQFRWYSTLRWDGRIRQSRALVHFGDTSRQLGRVKLNAGIALSSESLSVSTPRFEAFSEFAIRASDRVAREESAYALDGLYCLRSASTSEVEAELFIDRATWLFGACGGRFGFIHIATDHFAARAAVGFWRANPTGIEPLESTAERETWLYPHREQIGELASGAYWLVFLGASMCERLGGVAQVLHGAPVHEARAIEHGAVLLRTTRVPAPLTNPTVLAAVAALEEYLMPISVPIRKYFRDFGAGGGCADGRKLWGVW
jgi:hypothetical protein